MKKITQLFWLGLFLVVTPPGLAATEYVTDKIEIGLHQQPDINSPVISTLSTGDRVEVLQQHNDFKRVELDNGSQGWVNAAYLSETQPSTAEFQQLLDKNKELGKTLEQKEEQLKKLQRDLQVRRDQLSNAQSTINELKKQAAGSGAPDEEIRQQLAEKERHIEQLQAEIENLKAQPEPASPNSPDAEQYRAQLEQQKKLNDEMRTRIELAQTFLTQEQLPSADEIDKWRPSLPGWYWGTLLTVLILGIGAGIGWMDYRLRRRHGGFRI